MHPGSRGAAFAVAFVVFQACATGQFGDRYEEASFPLRPHAPPEQLGQLIAGPVLERSAYVRAVLSANPTIEGARQAWRAALARVRQAGAFEDPMVEVAMAPLSIASASARFGYEVGIRQQLPWFGKRALERNVMTIEASASACDLDAVRREIAMTALLLYDQYYVALRSLEINARHVQLVQSLQAAATAQFEAGRGSAQDALQAEAELTHLERDAEVLAAERDVVVAQMNELLHRDPGAPLPSAVAELAARKPDGTRDPLQLEQVAIDQRAEISSARRHARAEAVKADLADREYYPSLTVSTSYSSMWDMPAHRWMVGVGVNLPLPTDRRAGMVDEARANRAQYETEVARMSDMARTQVYVALRKLDESQAVLVLFDQRLLPVARLQIDAAQAGFIASRSPFTAVVEAEKNLRGVELDHELARADCDRRHAELDRALGRIPGLDLEESVR